MGANVIKVLKDADDKDFARRILVAVDSDAKEFGKAIKARDEEISSLQAELAELKRLEGRNYDLSKQLMVKSAENDILRQSVEALQIRIAQLEGNSAAQSPQTQTSGSNALLWPKTTDTGTKGVLVPYSGPVEIVREGTVIENCIIFETISVSANNVTIRNCKIKTASYYGILQHDGSTNLTVENCEIDGQGSSGMTGIAIQAGSVIRRCNIHGMVIAIKTWGNNFIVEDNYIHDLAEESSHPDHRHFDGIANLGASNGVIRRNAIVMPPKDGGTAAVFLAAQQANISNVKVLNNLLTGEASYAAYADKSHGRMTDVVYDGNYIERGIHGFILNTSGAKDTNNVKWNDKTQTAPAPVLAWRAAP
ncbi:MAG: right-handed parallel beta-helix repeat-containing protein [Rhizobiaceae bacterium]|nr:right-handed parallel beta-helix repeat-containing protein [Rhizobiaceae bacterium]